MLENELPLEVKRELAKETHNETVEKFGLQESPIFTENFAAMRGLEHGPNHDEGDPADHTELFEFELKEYLRGQGDSLDQTDADMIRLAAVLHDIGKATTQQFDVVSDEQNELVGATAEQVAEAKKIKDDLMGEALGQSVAELSRGQLAKLLNGKPEADGQVQAELRRLAATKELPVALVANFRGHDKEGVQLAEQIITESNCDLTQQQIEDVKFMVEQHMMPLKPEQITLKSFKAMFVVDGATNEKRIAMLRAMGYADNAATVNKRQSKSSEIVRAFDARMEALKSELAEETRKEEEKQRQAELENKFFGGSLGKFVVQDLKTPKPEIGKVKAALTELFEKSMSANPDLTPEDFAVLMKAELGIEKPE